MIEREKEREIESETESQRERDILEAEGNLEAFKERRKD